MKFKLTAIILIGIMLSGFTLAQIDVQKEAATKSGAEKTVLSVGKILKDCQVFRYFLLGVFACGCFLGIIQGGTLLVETFRTRSFRVKSFYEIELSDLEEMLRGSAGSSELGHLLGILFTIGKSGKYSKGEFLNEIVRAARMRQERFRTFRNWMVFFSDSAGALGLLGTVFGMYLTFAPGKLDPNLVISGMGVALSTTLVGIIISLILNLITTFLNNIFDRQLEVAYQKGDELRFSFEKQAMESQTVITEVEA